MELDGDAEVRWKQGWDLLSTPETLLADRRWLVEQEKKYVASRNVSAGSASV